MGFDPVEIREPGLEVARIASEARTDVELALLQDEGAGADGGIGGRELARALHDLRREDLQRRRGQIAQLRDVRLLERQPQGVVIDRGHRGDA